MGFMTVRLQAPTTPLPSCAVARITVLPAFWARTSPLEAFTVATLGSSLLHVTRSFVASSGHTVVPKYSESPLIMVVVDGETLMEVTKTSCVTVTTQDAFLPLPSVAVAVMVAEPAAKPLTTPLVTVAILLLEDSQRNCMFVALSGKTVA